MYGVMPFWRNCWKTSTDDLKSVSYTHLDVYKRQLYGIAGLLWVVAALLQIKMRGLSMQAQERGVAVGPDYLRAQRQWMLLGIPAFLAAAATVVVMVVKPMLW